MGLDIHSLLVRSDCSAGSDSSECEKPTSKILINVVPTVIMGVIVLVSIIVLLFLSRRRKRLDALEDAKARIEADDFGISAHPGAGRRSQVSMVPTYSQQRRPPQLAVPPAAAVARDRSTSPRAFDTEFDKSPYYHASVSAAPNTEGEISAEAIAKMAQKERHMV